MRLLPPEVYQPQAAEVFEALRGELAAALPHARIEHVGSSSIPGAVSKGDLDVCIAVAHEEFEPALHVLLERGWRIKPGTRRTAQLCMLIGSEQRLDCALQLIEQGSEFEFFFRFRDALSNNLKLVEQYNRVKQEAAPLGERQYRHAKGDFIRQVLREHP